MADGPNTRTPLHLACYFGSLEAARLLIEYGANVNALAQDNVRPLGFAVMKNRIEIVAKLEQVSLTGSPPPFKRSGFGNQRTLSEE